MAQKGKFLECNPHLRRVRLHFSLDNSQICFAFTILIIFSYSDFWFFFFFFGQSCQLKHCFLSGLQRQGILIIKIEREMQIGRKKSQSRLRITLMSKWFKLLSGKNLSSYLNHFNSVKYRVRPFCIVLN